MIRKSDVNEIGVEKQQKISVKLRTGSLKG